MGSTLQKSRKLRLKITMNLSGGKIIMFHPGLYGTVVKSVSLWTEGGFTSWFWSWDHSFPLHPPQPGQVQEAPNQNVSLTWCFSPSLSPPSPSLLLFLRNQLQRHPHSLVKKFILIIIIVNYVSIFITVNYKITNVKLQLWYKQTKVICAVRMTLSLIKTTDVLKLYYSSADISKVCILLSTLKLWVIT